MTSPEKPVSGTADDYYIAIGKALSEFSNLEHSLCRVFCASMGRGLANIPAYHAFWAIASFEGKQKMTSVAAHHATYRHTTLSAEWDKLAGQVKKKGKIRNKIAHGTLVGLHGTEPPTSFLIPYFWSGLLRVFSGPSPAPKDRMTIGQIDHARCAFSLTGRKLDHMAGEILALLEAQQ
jgi:hypothetical protein